jgi:hypothetical protein
MKPPNYPWNFPTNEIKWTVAEETVQPYKKLPNLQDTVQLPKELSS